MAMGTRKQRERQEDIWIAHTELASAPAHPFCQRLNELLEAEGFDQFVESRCAKFYAAKNGRPSLTPGIYFRSLLIGYFEGIDSERGIAWRMADSLGLRRFVGIGLALASSVVASMPIRCPRSSPRSASRFSTQLNTSLCVSTSISRRVREIVEWSGVSSSNEISIEVQSDGEGHDSGGDRPHEGFTQQTTRPTRHIASGRQLRAQRRQ